MLSWMIFVLNEINQLVELNFFIGGDRWWKLEWFVSGCSNERDHAQQRFITRIVAVRCTQNKADNRSRILNLQPDNMDFISIHGLVTYPMMLLGSIDLIEPFVHTLPSTCVILR